MLYILTRENGDDSIKDRPSSSLCIGKDCPYTCCRDWNILIDRDTMANYRKEPGLLGAAVKLCSSSGSYRNRCLFHGLDGLCYFQKNNRLDLMPKVCQLYPRMIVDFGEHKEWTHYLSCYNMAQEFIKNPGRYDFVKVQEDMPSNWTIGNKDEDFLEFLQRNRASIVEALWKNSSWRERLEDIYRKTYAQNMALTEGKFIEYDQCHPKNVPSITPVQGYLFFPVHFLNDLLLNHVMNSRSCRRGTFLCKAMNRYARLTGGLTEKEADAYMEGLISQILTPEMALIFDSYLSYLIQQDYCMAYEDYYMIGPVLSAIVSAELFIVLCATELESGKRLDEDYLAALLCNLEKATRSSLTFDKKIMDKVREDYF